MSQPNPVIVEFLTKDLDSVLKAMKSIEAVVTRTEEKSVAAAKARATTITGLNDKQRSADMRAIIEQTKLLEASERQGTKAVSDGIRQRAKAKIDAYKAADRAEAAARRLGESEAKKYAASEIARANQTAQAKIDAYKKADAELSKARTKGESEAKRVVARENSAARAIAREQHRTGLEIQRGDMSAAPHLSPQARLAILRDAKSKSPEEQMKAVDKVRNLADENRARRAERKKLLAEEKADELTVLKQINQQAAAEDKRRADIKHRSIETAANAAGKLAVKQAKEEADARIAEERRVQKAREKFGSAVFGAGKTALKAAGGVVAHAANSFMNLGGGLSIEDGMQRELSFRGRASSIAATTETGVSQERLMGSARSVGIANGIDPEEVLKAYENVKKLDDRSLPQAIRVMPEMAKLAAATGTDMGQLGELAANITAGDADYFNNDKISQKEKDERLNRQLRVFTRQGIEGGVEISDFAKYGSRITAGATLFGGSREEAEANLGQAAQIARQRGGASGAAEATLAAQRFATDLQKKHGALKDLGIDVADKNGSLRSLEDITVDMLKKQSTVTGISEFKIGERGNRYLTGAADVYRNAGGGKKGEEAVRAMFRKGRTEISAKDVEDRAKKRNAEVDKQLEIAMIKLRTEVGTKLVPVLPPLIASVTKLVPYFGMLLDKLASVANWAANNPFSGFAALVTGFFIKELAAAKIADLIKKMISGGGEGGGGGGVPGGGVATKAVGMGILTGAVIAKAKLGYSEGQEAAQDLRAKVEAYQRGDHERGISPEAAQKIVTDAQQRLEKSSTLEQAANLATSPFVEASDRDYKKFKGDQGLVESDEGKRLLKELTDAIKVNNRKAEMNMPATPTSAGVGSGPADPGAPSRQGEPIGRRVGG